MAYLDRQAHSLLNRATIRMPYLPDSLSTDRYPLVAPRSPIRLRRIAEQLGLQFTRETRFDSGIYSAKAPSGSVLLLPSPRWQLAYARLVAGAVGMVPSEDPEYPGISWVYVHPYERGRGLVDDAWDFILSTWSGIKFLGPFTTAGQALRDRLTPG